MTFDFEEYKRRKIATKLLGATEHIDPINVNAGTVFLRKIRKSLENVHIHTYKKEEENMT
jgi:hypothetical protein